jgi:hypothetical protein
MPSEYTSDSVETLSYAEKVEMSSEGRKKEKKEQRGQSAC